MNGRFLLLSAVIVLSLLPIPPEVRAKELPMKGKPALKAPTPSPSPTQNPTPSASPSLSPEGVVSPSPMPSETPKVLEITVPSSSPSPTLAPSLPTKGDKKTLDQIEASVNSGLIFRSDVEKFRKLVALRSQLDPLFAGTPLAAAGSKASDSEIINFLIQERLIEQQFPKSDSEVEQEINMIQSSNRLTRAGLKDALNREGYSFSDYFELIRNSSSKRDLIDRDIRTRVNITDEDVLNYFNNHYSHEVRTPTTFHLGIISVSKASFKNSVMAKKAIEQALADIKKGETFEEVAKRVSDDPSAPTGGDLGVLAEDQISPLIKSQLKQLKPKEVSGILEDDAKTRFYLLRLLPEKSSGNDKFDKMKDQIRSQLAAKEFQHQITLWLDRQQQKAYIHRAGHSTLEEVPLAKP